MDDRRLRAHLLRPPVLRDGSEVNLDNGGGDRISVRLVANFPDYTPEPRAAEPDNVRASDPSGLVVAAGHRYVADAGSNSVRAVDTRTGEATTLTTFAPLTHGSTEAEAAPAGIRFFGDRLLVTLLAHCAGCESIPAGLAQVRIVDPSTGGDEPLITGLSAAADVLPVRGGPEGRANS